MATPYYTRRYLAYSKYHHLYRVVRCDRHRCVYCGDAAETLDHVPSLSHVARVGADAFRRHNVPFLLYPCCRDCNQRLYTCEFLTVQKRSRVLIKRLTRKLQQLKCREWTQSQLDELGPNLRKYIETHETVRGWLDRRLEILEDVAYYRMDSLI